jgi:isoamylase
VLQLVMDSLRYWVSEMHVDGFRFDLASALTQDLDPERRNAFFETIAQDPLISRAKLIAEPWHVGHDGYQVGNFPVGWAEWNGQYRDTVREFWAGAPSLRADLATRMAGSADLYEPGGRTPHASVNFVTAHDGFTLRDMVTYEQKHNEANGEDNRDGSDHNISVNHGVEGETDDPHVQENRRRHMRNVLATLFLSQGVPMILGGDEVGRTQRGNNNAYCQDNEISWYDWDAADDELLEFTRRLMAFRRDHPVFRRRRWFQGRPIRGHLDDLAWFGPDGDEMTDEAWERPDLLGLGMFLNGSAIPTPDAHGEPVTDDSFLVLLHADHRPVRWRLPGARWGSAWIQVLDTAAATPWAGDDAAVHRAGSHRAVAAHSLVVLRRA